MRVLVLLIVASIAWCGWLASAAWVQRHSPAAIAALNADWQICTTPALPPIDTPSPNKMHQPYGRRSDVA